jgi:hypothetical protein
MDAASAHEFFAASGGVAGALIGLLFVAISVAPERVLGPDAHEVHAVRAAATLTAFTNALTVALFGLIPTFHVGGPATAVAAVGLVFVLAALIRLQAARRSSPIKVSEFSFLAGLLVVFVIQLIAGIELDIHPNDSGDLQTICVLVVVCFLIGIGRAWELVGGPHIGLIGSLARRRDAADTERLDGSEEGER